MMGKRPLSKAVLGVVASILDVAKWRLHVQRQLGLGPHHRTNLRINRNAAGSDRDDMGRC